MVVRCFYGDVIFGRNKTASDFRDLGPGSTEKKKQTPFSDKLVTYILVSLHEHTRILLRNDDVVMDTVSLPKLIRRGKGKMTITGHHSKY